MYLLRNRIIGVACTVLFVSCGFIDLRPVEVTISPGKPDTILPEAHSPLRVMFNTEMVKKEAENSLFVTSGTSMVLGDRFWNGTTLVFTPVEQWKAGTRYMLSLSGMARSVDGREIRLDRSVAFYAVNRSAHPKIERHIPADGESVSVKDLCLELRFSMPMNRISVESSISVDGMGDKQFIWSDDDTVLKLIPVRNFSPWTVYRWTLRETAESTDGVPLAKAVSAAFCTDLDRMLPQVSMVSPALQTDGRWIATGGSLEEDFGPGLGIVVEFNKPMADESFRPPRFEPSLAGRIEKLSEKSMVFIPSRDPEPEVSYTLIISGDVKDTEGLKIGHDYRRTFTADIPYLTILSINDSNGTSVNPHDSQLLPVSISEVDGGLVRFTIRFSLPFTIEEKQKTALAISLSPFFPGNLDPIALRFVTWLSDDLLRMEWESLKPGSSDEPHYYRLSIPGGRSGIDSAGMYLQQNITVFMEAVK